jgi:hypothetical protein
VNGCNLESDVKKTQTQRRHHPRTVIPGKCSHNVYEGACTVGCKECLAGSRQCSYKTPHLQTVTQVVALHPNESRDLMKCLRNKTLGNTFATLLCESGPASKAMNFLRSLIPVQTDQKEHSSRCPKPFRFISQSAYFSARPVATFTTI